MTTKEATDFNAFNVEELKERLHALNAKTNGNKNELIKRLMEIDPTGSDQMRNYPKMFEEVTK